MTTLLLRNLPLVTIVSGPQGCGKTTFINWLISDQQNDRKSFIKSECKAKYFDGLDLEKSKAAITLYNEEPIVIETSDFEVAKAIEYYCKSEGILHQWICLED